MMNIEITNYNDNEKVRKLLTENNIAFTEDSPYYFACKAEIETCTDIIDSEEDGQIFSTMSEKEINDFILKTAWELYTMADFSSLEEDSIELVRHRMSELNNKED